MLTVSNSRLQLWSRCHYAHYLKYVEKIRKKEKSGPLQRGSIIHECIEAYNTGKSWKKPFLVFEKEFYKSTFSEERIELGDIPKMVKELLENYFYLYEDEPFKYLENELHFVLPLNGSIQIEGYIDALVEDENHKVWSKEYKTYRKMPDRDFLLFNSQSAIYTWALNNLGYNSQGMLWDIIKAKEPTKPQMTQKTGKMSLAKLDSTPYTIIKGIKELGLDPCDFKAFIQKHDYEGYFLRHKLRINQNIIDNIMCDTLTKALEIQSKGNVLKDRNLNKDCNWCDYRSICQGELMGLDVDYIIQNEYTKGEGNGKKKKKQENTNIIKTTRNRK